MPAATKVPQLVSSARDAKNRKDQPPDADYGLDWKRGKQEDILTCALPEVDVCFHLAAQTDARSD
ncbi:MAG: hypothetical protein ACLP50_04400, partial [Solirubrobacteraceae bacterium]